MAGMPHSARGRAGPKSNWHDYHATELSGYPTVTKAPKLRALAADPRVAVTIDGNEWPHKVLLVRGRASLEMLDDVSPEYERAAARYFGPEQGAAWVGTLRGKPMARIAITPGWVGILDFETRFPSALML